MKHIKQKVGKANQLTTSYMKLLFITWPGIYTGAVNSGACCMASLSAVRISEMWADPAPPHLRTSLPRPARPLESSGSAGGEVESRCSPEGVRATRPPPPLPPRWRAASGHRRGFWSTTAHPTRRFQVRALWSPGALVILTLAGRSLTHVTSLTASHQIRGRRSPGAPRVTRTSWRLELASPSSSPQSHLKLPPALPKN